MRQVKMRWLHRRPARVKINVWLEPEVRFIGRSGEVNAVESIA